MIFDTITPSLAGFVFCSVYRKDGRLIPRLTTIDKAILKDVTKTFFIILSILLVIVFSVQFVKILQKVAEGALNPDAVIQMLGFEMTKVSGVLVPPSYFFALLWILASMYRDSEMTALQAGGIGWQQLMRSVLWVALPAVILSGFLVLWGVPWANQQIEIVKAEEEKRSDIAMVQAGKFNEFTRGDLVVYAERVDPETGYLKNVFVQDRQRGKLGVVIADEAYQLRDEFSEDNFVVLASGKRYEGEPGAFDYQVSDFSEYALRMPVTKIDLKAWRMGAEDTLALFSMNSVLAKAELAYRFSVPLGVILFTLLAFPLARSAPRKDVYGRLGIAILVYFIFLNLQRVGERWIETEVLPAYLGLTWIFLLMAFFGGVIAYFDSIYWNKLKRSLEAKR